MRLLSKSKKNPQWAEMSFFNLAVLRFTRLNALINLGLEGKG